MGRLIAVLIWLLVNSVSAQNNIIQAKQLKNQTFSAKVIRIIDGDTMEILYQKSPIKIRLAHIDCPEKRSKQPFGTQAKKALSDLCFGEQVTVKSEKPDRYGRLVAVVINAKKQIVNQEMIKLGMAWHFTKYANHETYANLESHTSLELEKMKVSYSFTPLNNFITLFKFRNVIPKHKPYHF